MKPIRVACIGTGYFSQFHYDAWKRIEEVELVGACSLNAEEAKATGLPAFVDVIEMLRSVNADLVDIITPPASHKAMIETCVEAGIRTIICQKPFCTSIDEAKAVISLCNSEHVSLIVHENFRFQPWYRTMKQALEDGMLGTPHQLTFRLRTGDGQGPDAYLERQPYFQKMPKLLIRETGVHWIDTFRYLFGEPISVYADLRQMNPAIAGEDAGYFIMEFADGKRALFDANRHLDHTAENCRTTLGEALLEGNEGTITLSGNGQVDFRKFGKLITETILPQSSYQGFAGDCVFALQSHVIQSIRGGRRLENEAKDYLKVLGLEEAIYRSAETGNKIFVSK